MSTIAANDRLTATVVATGGQTDFPADFPIYYDAEGIASGIHVRRVRAGVEAILVLTTHFTLVDVTDNNFTVRLNAGSTVGDKIQIYGKLPAERDRAHTLTGQPRNETLERDAANAQFQLQEARRDLDRAVSAPFGEAGLTLPLAAARAGALLAFDEDGRAIVGPTVADFQAALAALNAAQEAAEAAEGHARDAAAAAVVAAQSAAVAALVALGSSNVWLTPFMFNAIGNNVADDSAAIQAMFDFVQAANRAIPISFAGGKFYIGTGLVLPTVTANVPLTIRGDGAILRTDQELTILGRVPASQAAAEAAMDKCRYHISGFHFLGTQIVGQTGLHVGAVYTLVVQHCSFRDLEYGSIGTFCLAGHWSDLLYVFCINRAMVIQTGIGHGDTPIWTGASTGNSASNVTIIENCRDFGAGLANGQISSFAIFGSDAVVLRNCIHEGIGAKFGVEFNYQGSTTVKHFDVDGIHFESSTTKCNFRIRAVGRVHLKRIVWTTGAAFIDAAGSGPLRLEVSDMPYFGNGPVVSPGAGFDPANPLGRWFWHSIGQGYGGDESGVTEGNASSNMLWVFNDVPGAGPRAELIDPANWEAGYLPQVCTIETLVNAGVEMRGPYALPTPRIGTMTFMADESKIVAAPRWAKALTSGSIAAGATVTITTACAGAVAGTTIMATPADDNHEPPEGIIWNAWVSSAGFIKHRFTNITGGALTAATANQWVYTGIKQS